MIIATVAFVVGAGVGALWGRLCGHAEGLRTADEARLAEWKEHAD